MSHVDSHARVHVCYSHTPVCLCIGPTQFCTEGLRAQSYGGNMEVQTEADT